jgi:hypothetical protein
LLRTGIIIFFIFLHPFGYSQYNYYYGSLHSHTGFSDGNKDSVTTGYSTPAQNFNYVKQSYHVDFWGISEHNHYQAGMKTPADYHTGINSAMAANTDGTFVCLYGMEWGVISGGGHIVTYGIDSLIGWDKQADNVTNDYDIFCTKNDYSTYWNLLNARPASFSTLAHPQTGDYGNIVGSAYNPLFDNVVYGCAIRSGSASSSTTNYSDLTPGTSYEPFWQSLLAKGYHLAPNVDADNHYTNMGRHNHCRTGVLATSLTKAKIIDAYKSMRIYATEDWNVKANFSVNGNVMGSVVNTTANSSINVTVTDDDVTESFSRIQIWYGVPGSGVNPTLLTEVTNNNVLNFVHPTLTGSTYYYYAKITEADGDITWTAPVWITRLGALPSDIIYFNGVAQKESIGLNWQVGSGSDIAGFIMEKSLDGIQFNTIGTITDQQMNNSGNFTFTDRFPANGMQYYRLKITERNGRVYYSHTVPVHFIVTQLEVLQLFPHPVTDRLHIKILSKINTTVTAKIYDMVSGRELFSDQVTILSGIQTLNFKTGWLHSGTFVLVFSRPNERMLELPFVK